MEFDRGDEAGDEDEVVGPGFDAAADAVHDGAARAELARRRARRRTRRRDRPSPRARALDRRGADAHRCARPTPPSRRAARRRAARRSRRRRARRSGGSQVDAPPVERRGDRLERGRRHREPCARLGASAPQLARVHAGAQRGDHRLEPRVGDGRRRARRRRRFSGSGIVHSSANSGPASTISASGIARARRRVRHRRHPVDGDSPRVARPVDRGRGTASSCSGFHVTPYRCSTGNPAGRPRRCSQAGAPRRCARTTTQPGENARVPASQSRAASETVRAFASRPSTSTSMPSRAIRSRAQRRAGSRGTAVVECGPGREPHVAVVGHRDDLLRAVAGAARRPR